MPSRQQARLKSDALDELAWRGAGQPLRIENISAVQWCAAADAASEQLAPVGNHQLTAISSDELASRVVADRNILRADHQEQPANNTEYVSGLNVTSAIPDIRLNLNAPTTAAKQEAALSFPAGPGEELTRIP